MPRSPVTVRRWQIAAAFVFLCLSFVVVAIVVNSTANSARETAHRADELAIQNRNLIVRLAEAQREINHTKASVVALNRTDCALAAILRKARAARLAAANLETGPLREADLRAARSYAPLLQSFAGLDCAPVASGR